MARRPSCRRGAARYRLPPPAGRLRAVLQLAARWHPALAPRPPCWTLAAQSCSAGGVGCSRARALPRKAPQTASNWLPQSHQVPGSTRTCNEVKSSKEEWADQQGAEAAAPPPERSSDAICCTLPSSSPFIVLRSEGQLCTFLLFDVQLAVAQPTCSSPLCESAAVATVHIIPAKYESAAHKGQALLLRRRQRLALTHAV